MSFTVIARYRAEPGAADQLLPLLDEMAAASRREPGCRGYRVHRGTDDPDEIALYEEYGSEADFDAHCASEHFRRIVLGQVVPRLVHREVLRCAPRAEREETR